MILVGLIDTVDLLVSRTSGTSRERCRPFARPLFLAGIGMTDLGWRSPRRRRRRDDCRIYGAAAARAAEALLASGANSSAITITDIAARAIRSTPALAAALAFIAAVFHAQ